MSHLSIALRAATATVLTGGFAFAGTATATADPTNTGNSSDINTLAASLSKGYSIDNCTAQNITTGEREVCPKLAAGVPEVLTEGARRVLDADLKVDRAEKSCVGQARVTLTKRARTTPEAV